MVVLSFNFHTLFQFSLYFSMILSKLYRRMLQLKLLKLRGSSAYIKIIKNGNLKDSSIHSRNMNVAIDQL